jgi:hypothetical protein
MKTKASVLHLVFLTLLGGVTSSCATTSAPGALTEARMSLIASSNGPAATLAPSYLDDAKGMLERANREFARHGNSDVCRDYSYIAENRFELADAIARAELLRQTVGGGNAPGLGLRTEGARSSKVTPLARVR